MSFVLVQAVAAQEPEDINAFNKAWFAYLEAKESGSKQRTLDAAHVALENARQTFAPDDERLPLLMNNYGVALREAGKRSEAREVLAEALEMATAVHGEAALELVPILMAYGDALAKLRNPDKQERRYNEALRITGKHHGRDSREFADVSFRAGLRISELTRTTEGRRHLYNALEIYEELLGAESREAGLAEFYIAKLNIGRRSYREAEKHLVRALAALEGDAEYKLYVHAYLVQVYESQRESDKATEHCLAIGAMTPMSPDQDYQPLFRMQPKYPPDMLRAGEQGYVDFEFTVDEAGFVRDPVVIRQEGGKSFEKEALAVVERFRYAPQFRDGQPVAVDGVKTRISFKIQKRD